MSANGEFGMAAIEQAAVYIATLTGMKQQFMDAGWSELVAEHMVFEMVRQGGRK